MSTATTNLGLVKPGLTDSADIAVINANADIIDGLAGDVATFETSPSTASHSVGEYLLYDGHVYVVTSAISAGDSLTLGTNVRAANLGAEIKTLRDSVAGLLVAVQFSGSINSGQIALGVDGRSYAVVSVKSAYRCVPYMYGNWWYATFANWDLSVLPNGTEVSGTVYVMRT